MISRGLRRALSWSPIIPRDTSLSYSRNIFLQSGPKYGASILFVGRKFSPQLTRSNLVFVNPRKLRHNYADNLKRIVRAILCRMQRWIVSIHLAWKTMLQRDRFGRKFSEAWGSWPVMPTCRPAQALGTARGEIFSKSTRNQIVFTIFWLI